MVMRFEIFLSMKKEESIFKKGFSLVEVILAGALFVLIVTALVGAFVYAKEATAITGDRARAFFLADEGLEVVRNIRDEDFSNLADGNYGLSISGGEWIFSGTSDVTGIFSRQITIFSIDPNRKQVTSEVSWTRENGQSRFVSVSTYLTNWVREGGGGPVLLSCAVYCQSLNYSGGVCRANSVQCNKNGETYESGGDSFCVLPASLDTCCCQP